MKIKHYGQADDAYARLLESVIFFKMVTMYLSVQIVLESVTYK